MKGGSDMKTFVVILMNGTAARITSESVKQYDSYTIEISCNSKIMFEIPILKILELYK